MNYTKKGLPIDDDNSEFYCPRCNSSRYIVETDYELMHDNMGGYEVAIETDRCRLCGFNPGKNKPKGIKERLKRIFGLYRRKRLKRPELDGRLFLS